MQLMCALPPFVTLGCNSHSHQYGLGSSGLMLQAEMKFCSHVGPPQPSRHSHRPSSTLQFPCLEHPTAHGLFRGTSGRGSPGFSGIALRLEFVGESRHALIERTGQAGAVPVRSSTGPSDALKGVAGHDAASGHAEQLAGGAGIGVGH